MTDDDLDQTRRRYIDQVFPFIEPHQAPPGEWVPTDLAAGSQQWRGQKGWRTRRGPAVVLWFYGQPVGAFDVLYPDGTRGEVQHRLDHGWRRRSSGPTRWIYGDLRVEPDDAIFADGQQPVYAPPGPSSVPNLEADLARDAVFLLELKDDRFARAVYRVFMNRTFYKDAGERAWTCGDRQAARLVASLRSLGESYQDFFLDYEFAGVWPDDRAQREGTLHELIERNSGPLVLPDLKLRVPGTIVIDGSPEKVETEDQAEAILTRLRQQIEQHNSKIEESQATTVEQARNQLAKLNANADVFGSLHAHLARLGWRTENEADRQKARTKAMERDLAVLHEIKELEQRPATHRESWTKLIEERRKRGASYQAIRKGALDRLSADERAVVLGQVRRRLEELALSGRVTEHEYGGLSSRLNR